MVSKDLFTLLVTIEIFDATSRSQLVQLHEVMDAHEHQHGQGPAVESVKSAFDLAGWFWTLTGPRFEASQKEPKSTRCSSSQLLTRSCQDHVARPPSKYRLPSWASPVHPSWRSHKRPGTHDPCLTWHREHSGNSLCLWKTLGSLKIS